MAAAKRKKPAERLFESVAESAVIRCAAGFGAVREEVWVDASGKEVRYNLAFINHHLFAADNGRVLGYDTAHGRLHRHAAGSVEPIEPAPYTEILERFIAEVEDLRKKETL